VVQAAVHRLDRAGEQTSGLLVPYIGSPPSVCVWLIPAPAGSAAFDQFSRYRANGDTLLGSEDIFLAGKPLRVAMACLSARASDKPIGLRSSTQVVGRSAAWGKVLKAFHGVQVDRWYGVSLYPPLWGKGAPLRPIAVEVGTGTFASRILPLPRLTAASAALPVTAFLRFPSVRLSLAPSVNRQKTGATQAPPNKAATSISTPAKACGDTLPSLTIVVS